VQRIELPRNLGREGEKKRIIGGNKKADPKQMNNINCQGREKRKEKR
jgi:hypothetical protein